jgi:FkbM family methyltransferase
MYRKRRVARLIGAYSPRVERHNYGGLELAVALADPLGEAWYDHDWPRLDELDQLARMGALRPGVTVFDLGAHQGIVALMLAGEVGPSGAVIAVEAEPHNASIAQRNVELNRAANVTVVHAAISDRSGILHFAESLNGHVDEKTRLGNVDVRAMTIDQLADEYGPPDVVFIDVEGYEGKALSGAGATLRSRLTTFLIEVHGDDLVDCTAGDLIARFAGYATFAAEPLPDGSAAFTPFSGPPPAGRFFLAAAPASTA